MKIASVLIFETNLSFACQVLRDTENRERISMMGCGREGGTVNTEHLSNFVKMVDAGGVREAARTTNVSSSALSYSIKMLESFFGTEVVVHNRRGMVLTPFGCALLDRGKRMLRTEGELLEIAKDAGGGASSPHAFDEAPAACPCLP